MINVNKVYLRNKARGNDNSIGPKAINEIESGSLSTERHIKNSYSTQVAAS